MRPASVPGSTAGIPAPLQKPASTILHFAVQLTLERGVLLNRVTPQHPGTEPSPGYFAYGFPDLWQATGREEQPPKSLQAMQQALMLKPVLLTVQKANWNLEDFVIPPNGGVVGELAIQEIQQATHSLRDLAMDAASTGYVLAAIVYHCRQLAGLYRATALPGELRPWPSDRFLLHGAVEPYFEFDALIAAVIRAYETSRVILWKAFGSRGSCPRNFERVVKAVPLPSVLLESATSALESYGRAKKYRDCLQHNAQFGARLPHARVEHRAGIAWSMTALLPDNPEARSFHDFSYRTETDAMEYGWRAAFEAIHFAQIAINAIQQAVGAT